MYKQLLLILILSAYGSLALGANQGDCKSMMLDFITRADKRENVALLNNSWTASEKKKFLTDVKAQGFSDENIKVMIDSLNAQEEKVSVARTKDYLTYVLTFSEKNQKKALLDLREFDAKETTSKHVKKFIAHENKIEEKFKNKKLASVAEKKRYKELYYGCRSFSPNEVNKNAVKDFKRFNLALTLGTFVGSYAFYNKDKEIDADSIKKLGYDIGTAVLFNYLGSRIQTKIDDGQVTKSLKSYFMGRVLGLTDIAIYDPMLNKEREKAEARLELLKKDPKYKAEIAGLLKSYEERSLYRKFKDNLISNLKKLPEGLSLGMKGESIDENNVDWNNLSYADLDRPEVQEVLVAASMAQIYQEGRGEWVDTGDIGADRYAFNTVFYALQIPKNIASNFITYRILCMGQDNKAASFTKAVIFNVSLSFIVNQVLYGYRNKAINQ